jgi:hypothetical protein
MGTTKVTGLYTQICARTSHVEKWCAAALVPLTFIFPKSATLSTCHPLHQHILNPTSTTHTSALMQRQQVVNNNDKWTQHRDWQALQGRGLRPARLEPLEPEVGFFFSFYCTNDYLKVQYASTHSHDNDNGPKWTRVTTGTAGKSSRPMRLKPLERFFFFLFSFIFTILMTN